MAGFIGGVPNHLAKAVGGGHTIEDVLRPSAFDDPRLDEGYFLGRIKPVEFLKETNLIQSDDKLWNFH